MNFEAVSVDKAFTALLAVEVLLAGVNVHDVFA